MTEFEQNVRIALIKKGIKQKQLIEEVHTRTGFYFDRKSLRRIFKGECKNEKIVYAIKEILGI